MTFSKITFLPVDNGNMILIKLNDFSKTTILYDMYIREKSKDVNDESFDVLQYLKDNLEVDKNGRLFVDVFILSHHDDDHIKGFENHFHIGDINNYVEGSNKIYIKEMWGSARFLKRSSLYNKLTSDAKVFNTEMNRCFNLYIQHKKIQEEGNRIRILGACPNGGTNNATAIVHELQSTITKFNERDLSGKIKVHLLGPLEQQEGEDDDNFKKKNRGSVILQFEIFEGARQYKILLTGDAEADVCELLEKTYLPDYLEYDILQAPHHCSQYSIMKKIFEDGVETEELSENALKALSHKKTNAMIIASCKDFSDITPPHLNAKKEYENIVLSKNFLYTSGHKVDNKIRPIEIELTSDGHKKSTQKTNTEGLTSGLAAASQPRGHGKF